MRFTEYLQQQQLRVSCTTRECLRRQASQSFLRLLRISSLLLRRSRSTMLQSSLSTPTTQQDGQWEAGMITQESVQLVMLTTPTEHFFMRRILSEIMAIQPTLTLYTRFSMMQLRRDLQRMTTQQPIGKAARV